MHVHSLLIDPEAESLHFEPEDLTPLGEKFPRHHFVYHHDADSLLSVAAQVDYLLTWRFEADWYRGFTRLQHIYTPAAGRDWVAPDPTGSVGVTHGTFHGPVLGESLLSALLFMNHRMPDMIRNHGKRQWNRNLQSNTRLLRSQEVLIVGFGHIGRHCASMLAPLAGKVRGIRRSRSGDETFDVADMTALPERLSTADHVVLLLPGGSGTERFLTSERLAMIKPGAYVYNFGRGNALYETDLLPALSRNIAGAFLDVTQEEPLPGDSPLWSHPNVFVTPHSSCMYRDYTALFINEVAARLAQRFGERLS